MVPGPLARSVASLTADSGAVSFIPAWSHTFMEIDHEIISLAILLLVVKEGLFQLQVYLTKKETYR